MGPVEATAADRRPEVVGVARWLDVNPALTGPERAVAQVFAVAAMDLLGAVGVDTPDLVVALRSLVSAKDDAVRASIAGRGGR